MMKYFD